MSSQLRLALVDPGRLDLAWPAIEEGLNRIKKRAKNATWTLSQVVNQIRSGRAEVYAAYSGERYRGFVLLAEVQEAFTGERKLLVWAAYTPEHDRGLILATRDAIDEIARARGIHKILMSSSRKGWRRLAEKLGFYVYETYYEREI